MKEDKLKDFVNRQRQEFESHEGDYEIMWDEIESGLNKMKGAIPTIFSVLFSFTSK